MSTEDLARFLSECSKSLKNKVYGRSSQGLKRIPGMRRWQTVSKRSVRTTLSRRQQMYVDSILPSRLFDSHHTIFRAVSSKPGLRLPLPQLIEWCAMPSNIPLGRFECAGPAPPQNVERVP